MRVQSPVTFFISTFFQQHLIRMRRMRPRQRDSLVVGVCNIHPAAIQRPSVEQWIDTDIYLWRPGNKWNNTWLPFSWIETFEQHMHVTKGTITWLCYCYSRRRPNPFWEYSLFLDFFKKLRLRSLRRDCALWNALKGVVAWEEDTAGRSGPNLTDIYFFKGKITLRLLCVSEVRGTLKTTATFASKQEEGPCLYSVWEDGTDRFILHNGRPLHYVEFRLF